MKCQGFMRWTTLFIATAALVAVFGCGSEQDPGSDTARFPVPTEIVPAVLTPAPTSTPMPEPSPEPSPVPTAGESDPSPTSEAMSSAEPSPTSTSDGSKKVRLPAPDFTLPSASGASVTLSDLLVDSKGVVLVFYRGFF